MKSYHSLLFNISYKDNTIILYTVILPAISLSRLTEHFRMHKIQIRLFACYKSGRARRILFPRHACHRARNGYQFQGEPLGHPSALCDENATSFLFSQNTLLTMLFQIRFDYFKCSLCGIFFRQLDHKKVL